MGHEGQTAEAEKEFSLGIAALAADDTLTALPHLERALKLRDHAGWYSSLGYCIARERGQYRRGEELCRQAMAAEPDNPCHYLNLGRVHIVSGDKMAALRVLREGMTKGPDPDLARLLERLGSRQATVLPMFARSNPLNRYLGLILSRLGLRKPR
jgi:Flp pilus assembly protein TadD